MSERLGNFSIFNVTEKSSQKVILYKNSAWALPNIKKRMTFLKLYFCVWYSKMKTNHIKFTSAIHLKNCRVELELGKSLPKFNIVFSIN